MIDPAEVGGDNAAGSEGELRGSNTKRSSEVPVEELASS